MAELTEFEKFKELIPENISKQIPKKRQHHAFYNLYMLVKKQNSSLLNKAITTDANPETKKEFILYLNDKFQEVINWHEKNGFVKISNGNLEEIKRDPINTNPDANKRIVALIKPEYINRIPSFVRKHATGKTCGLIAREFPDLYTKFLSEPNEDDKTKMSELINSIFEERMAKHNM